MVSWYKLATITDNYAVSPEGLQNAVDKFLQVMQDNICKCTGHLCQVSTAWSVLWAKVAIGTDQVFRFFEW